MNSPPARDVLARNLSALMKAHPQFGTLPALETATVTRGGKIGKSTIGRILTRETPVNLDYLETLAKVFGLAPWQMLIPDLNPQNPQILRRINADEEGLYQRIGDLVKQIAELPKDGS